MNPQTTQGCSPCTRLSADNIRLRDKPYRPHEISVVVWRFCYASMVILHATCNMLRGCPEVVMAGRRRLPLSRDGRGVSSWRWFIGRRKSRRRWVVTGPQSDREDQPGGFHRAGVLRFPFTAGLL